MEKLICKNQVIVEKEANEKSFGELKALVQICNENDNTELTFHLDDKEDDITKFLFYSEQKLIGYFGMASSYIEGEAVVWGTIHPSNRGKDIFCEFFEYVKEKCRGNNFDKLKVINERRVTSLGDIVTSIGGVLRYSTYKMNFNKEDYKEEREEYTGFVLNRASLEDIEDMIPIGMEAFGTSEEEERSYNESNLKDGKYSNFIGEINNIPVGIISAKIGDGKGSIADLAVLKSYRRRGIGSVILSKTIAYLLNQGIEKFSLSVQTENKNALSLYENLGFRIVTASDCYEIKI